MAVADHAPTWAHAKGRCLLPTNTLFLIRSGEPTHHCRFRGVGRDRPRGNRDRQPRGRLHAYRTFVRDRTKATVADKDKGVNA